MDMVYSDMHAYLLVGASPTGQLAVRCLNDSQVAKQRLPCFPGRFQKGRRSSMVTNFHSCPDLLLDSR